MAADLAYLPDNVMKGAVGKILDRTHISTTDTNYEYRTPVDPFPRRAWLIGWNKDEVDAVETLFEVNGRAYSFLIFAPRTRDHNATNQLIGTGDGTNATFQLKIIRSTGVRTAQKNILHPKSGTVVIKVDGVTKTETTHYAINYSTGVVTFTGGNEPANGHEVRADFDHYTAVRWSSEELLTKIDRVGTSPLQEIRQATIIEVLNE